MLQKNHPKNKRQKFILEFSHIFPQIRRLSIKTPAISRIGIAGRLGFSE
jgi:hypothetical protein